jgi:hypothetical protein
LQHWFFTDAEWDPTGRYLATFLTHRQNGYDNGYRLWSFSGKEIGLDKGKSFSPQKLFQFCWRPRPVSLLSKDQVKAIIRRLKDKPEEFEKFDREDSARLAFQERCLAAALCHYCDFVLIFVAARCGLHAPHFVMLGSVRRRFAMPLTMSRSRSVLKFGATPLMRRWSMSLRSKRLRRFCRESQFICFSKLGRLKFLPPQRCCLYTS